MNKLSYNEKSVIKHIYPINRQAFSKLIEQLQLKAYSNSTIKTYSIEFAQLLYFLKDISVDSINSDYIKSLFVVLY
jgi:hypothetical protein